MNNKEKIKNTIALVVLGTVFGGFVLAVLAMFATFIFYHPLGSLVLVASFGFIFLLGWSISRFDGMLEQWEEEDRIKKLAQEENKTND